MSEEHKPTSREAQAEVLAAALKAREEQPQADGANAALEAALQAKFNNEEDGDDG
jgi:hypothetical protein